MAHRNFDTKYVDLRVEFNVDVRVEFRYEPSVDMPAKKKKERFERVNLRQNKEERARESDRHTHILLLSLSHTLAIPPCAVLYR